MSRNLRVAMMNGANVMAIMAAGVGLVASLVGEAVLGTAWGATSTATGQRVLIELKDAEE